MRLGYGLILGLLVSLTACRPRQSASPETSPVVLPVHTRADSLALRVYQAYGGPEVWQALPYIRFDYAVAHDGPRRLLAHHLWHRPSGRYRLEWVRENDSLYVALFNVRTRRGQVYHNGRPLAEPANRRLLEEAYRRFVHDTFWLLLPVQLFEPGVQRFYEADSATAAYEVLRLELTRAEWLPARRYWVYVDRQEALVVQLAYFVPGSSEALPARYRWEGHQTWETPFGPVRLATRKIFLYAPLILFTDNLAFPATLPEALFLDPLPRLGQPLTSVAAR
ncbi:hypothetical protein [Rhodothermus profundi]|uniref:Outer membrane lipoprotein-sorting protein n=1 Tax=Rhodothermus profundi TaxID=633813 RepID=A0A1M6W3M2_9BACT|nr:hypothetical protein [Rhodothermus profundi]SHK88279.1 hypothetical protein SAMN04488087_2225 [Rhodothermus profundi]